jgi:FlaA1/EpsC-like NDP-sugar epimerase
VFSVKSANSVLIRNRYVLLADVVMLAVAAWIAFALRFGLVFRALAPEFPAFIVTSIFLKITVFFVFGLYRRFWRYASFWDLMSVVVANAVGSLIFATVMVWALLSGFIPQLSRSVVPIDFLLGLALTTAVRASVRVIAETTSAPRGGRIASHRRVLIVGAGDAGALVAREMQKNPQLGQVPIAFVDDESAKLHKRIYGVPVVGQLSDLAAVTEGRPIDEVVIAMPRAGGAVVRAVAETCRRQGLPSRVVPGIYELLGGQVAINHLRDVQISDLLRRPQVMSDERAPAYLTGATIVVTGAGGSIGSELCRQVAHAGAKQLILVGHGENSIFEIAVELQARFPQLGIESVIADIRDRDRIGRVLRTIRPTVVFHAAAHKHVPLMEANIAEAITNNVLGTRNVVEAAAEAGTDRLVLVSTDKAVAPTSVMGASKRLAEMILRDAARRHRRQFVVVRFGNVLGSRGSVVPLFRSQIERGGPVTVTHPDVRRFFMTIPESVHLVRQAGGLGNGGELYVLDMGEPVYLRDLAADMIRLSGFEEHEISIIFTGLRPGEKLNESLWEDQARVEPTLQPDIRVVDEPESISPERLRNIVDRLIEAAGRDDARVVSLLAECIPTANLSPRPRPSDEVGGAARIAIVG